MRRLNSLDILHFFSHIWSEISSGHKLMLRGRTGMYTWFMVKKSWSCTHTQARARTHRFLFLKLFVNLSKIFFSFLGWDGAGTHAVTQRALALLRSDAGSTVGDVMECIASQEEYCQDIDFKAEAEKRQDINKILTPTWRDIFISNYIRVFYSILWLLRRCN